MARMSKDNKWWNISIGRFVIYSFLAFAAVFYGVPLIWLFIASTKDQVTLFSETAFTFGTWENVVTTWNDLSTYNNFQILDWALNSVIYSVGGVAVTLFTAIPAGYALALYDFPGRKAFLILTLIAMIVPSQAIVLPLFLELLALNLTNSYLGLILAVGFFPFGVYLAYVFFATALPNGVMEAARTDGCNRFQLFIHMGLPLAKPIIALVAFFSFLANWSNYFLAFVLLSDESLFNLPLGLTTLLSGAKTLSGQGANEIPIEMPEAIQAAIVVVLPVLIVFLVSQRFVRTGMLAGSEKG